MKTVRIYITKSLLTFSMLLVCLWATAQCIHSDTLSGCPDTLYVGDANTPTLTIPTGIYSAEEYLHSDGSVLSPDTVDYKSKHIRMNRGFRVLDEGKFSAYIENICDTGFNASAYYVNDSSLGGDVYTTNVGSDFTGTGDKDNPFASLKYVIENIVLSEGDTIYVDAGTFNDVFIEINAPINNLVIKGAGSENTIFDKNYSNNAGTPAIASFLTISSDDILLEGMTIQGYNGTVAAKAVSVFGAQCLVIKDIEISQNIGIEESGALLVGDDSTLDIIDSSISDNASDVDSLEGGGIDIIGSGSIINIDNSFVYGNKRRNEGGGIKMVGRSDLNIINSSLGYNSASKGGAIYLSSGAKATLRKTCIIGNITTSPIIEPSIENQGISISAGGGLYIGKSIRQVDISEVSFEDNQAGFHLMQGQGGSIYAGEGASNTGGSPELINIEYSKFNNNIATEGTDIYVDNQQVNINQTEFSTDNVVVLNNGLTPVIIQNSGNPSTIGLIDLININNPQTIDISCPTWNCISPTPTGASVQQFCLGDNPTVSDLVVSTSSVTWHVTPNGSVYSPNTPLVDGVVYYATNRIRGCLNSSAFAVTVDLIDVADHADAGHNIVICPNVEGVQIGTASQPGYTYLWSPPTGLNEINISNPIATPSQTTIYSLSVIYPGCDTIIDEVTVYVSDENINFPKDEEICTGGEVQLTIDGGIAYDWSPTTGLSCSDCPNPVATPSATTSYTVTVTDINGCEIIGNITVTVSENIVVDAGENITACVGDTISLLGTGADIYSWSPNTGLSCTECATPTLIVTDSITYTLTGIEGGCMNEDQVTISLEPEYYELELTYVIDSCEVVFNSGSGEFTQYQWSVDNVIVGTESTLLHEFPNNGIYYICLNVRGNCEDITLCESISLESCNCLDREPCLTLNINPMAVYDMTPDCSFTDIALSSSPSGGIPDYIYNWGGPDGFTSTLQNPGIANATTINNGTYSITVTDANGCIETGSVDVNIDSVSCGCSGIYISEFAYDCKGIDYHEFIEIVVPNSFTGNIADVQVDFYSGGEDGIVYQTDTLENFLYNVVGDSTYYYIEYTNVIQNGLNSGEGLADGIALSYLGTVCEFISYEGQITADGGPADEMISEDVMVEQENNGVCMVQSIQLTSGGGWMIACATPGNVNQTLNIDDPCDDGDATTINDQVQFDCSCSGASVACPGGFINEFAYDCKGADSGEFIEVAIPAGSAPGNYRIYLYRGDGTYYDDIGLGNSLDFSDVNYDYYSVLTPGLQNAGTSNTPDTDGIALSYSNGDSSLVCDFISYEEGVITATNGPAAGMTSDNVGAGIYQDGTAACMEESIQLYNGQWVVGCSTRGNPNTNAPYPCI